MNRNEIRDLMYSHLNELFQFHEDVCKEMDEEYKNDLKELEQIFYGEADESGKVTIGDKTPQQTKKRSKRLSTLDERNGAENNSKIDISGADSTKSTRLPRAAKTNLDLKEKPLGQKIRRPSNFDSNSISIIHIKQEKMDDSPKKLKKSRKVNQDEVMQVDEVSKNSVFDTSVEIVQKQNAVVEVESDGEVDKMPPPLAPAPKKRGRRKKMSEESLDVDISKSIKNENISIISANETDNMVSKRKKKNQEIDTDLSFQSSSNVSKAQKKKSRKVKQLPKPIIVKEEKKSLPNDEMESSKEREKDDVKRISDKETSRQSQKCNRVGSFESVYEDAIPSQQPEQSKKTSENEMGEPISSPEAASVIPSTNTAPSIPSEPVKESVNNKTSVLDVTKNCSANERNSDKADDATFVSAKAGDATFVSVKDIPTASHNIAVAMVDSTFIKNNVIINSEQVTFVVRDKENMNSTVTLQQGNVVNSDTTFDVHVNPEINSHVRDSIMTEDNTEEEIDDYQQISKNKYKPKPKSKMEKNQVFNPFIQSPLKKKIEAFEKVAANAADQNPPQRQTRTKTKAKEKQQNDENSEIKTKAKEKQQNDENSEIKNKVLTALKETSKNITPTIGRPLGRILTPSQSSSSITPTIGNLVKKMPNSASKAIGLTKALSSVSKNSAGTQSARSRDNSIEDLKRGYLKFQEIAAERKKKREEKQQQVTYLREQKEKERAERLKRVMEEREEKLKNAEQKRQVEEIQKNLKLLEEKNEQKRKLEKQKLLEKTAAAAAKKEREMLESLKVQKAKEKMQLEYLKNQKLLQTKTKDTTPKYNFDMLQTDDETDEEEGLSKKRPPLPDWSRKEVRKSVLEKQAWLPTRIIDNFFSVQPLTPDLREIFPAIDSRHCKRNSSIYWSTPPRYSELPKY